MTILRLVRYVPNAFNFNSVSSFPRLMYRPSLAINCRSLSDLSKPSGDFSQQPKKSVFGRIFKFAILVSVLTGTGIYFSKDFRNYLSKNVGGFDDFIGFIEPQIGGFYDATPKKEPVQEDLPAIRRPQIQIDPMPNQKVEGESSSTSNSYDLQSYQEIESYMKQKSELISMEHKLLEEDLDKLLSVAHSYVTNAQHALKKAELAGLDYQNYLFGRLGSKSDKNDKSSKLIDTFKKEKEIALKSVSDAQHQLSVLKTAINKTCEEKRSLGMPRLKEIVEKYKNLHYDLNKNSLKVPQLESELATLKSRKTYFDKFWEEVEVASKETLPELAMKEKKDKDLNVQELNALLTFTYQSIDKLRNYLKLAKDAEMENVRNASQLQKEQMQDLVQRKVDIELFKLTDQFILEKLKWEEEAAKTLKYELSLALARHSEHLEQMLKIKNDEAEVKFKQKLRQAVIEERAKLKQSISGWVKRMEAIEEVVENRANLDEISKRAQAFWLAVQTLATSIDFPGSTKSEPLTPLLASIKATAPSAVVASPKNPTTFSDNLLSLVPVQAAQNGIWTSAALKERFSQVYRNCRRVVSMDELAPSLWQYMRSSLQSMLTFDSTKASLPQRLLTGQIHSQYLLRRDSEIDEKAINEDPYRLLDSARVAVENGDLEFALKLMLQLEGQAKLLAKDWINAVQEYLEMSLISQALLANAAATGLTAFEDRL